MSMPPGTQLTPAAQGLFPLANAFGLISCNFNPSIAGGTTPPTSGRMDAVALYLPPGETINNIFLTVQTPGSGLAPTGFFVGLAAPTPALGGTGLMLAQSANLAASAALTTAGIQAFQLSAPYVTKVADSAKGFYYVCLLENGAFGTTNVAFERGNGTNPGLGTASNNGWFGNIGTGLVTPPANGAGVTFSSGAGLGWWVGVG